MSRPINPPPATGGGDRDLPAYVSNGLIGLRVRYQPLQAGMALVSGYVGEDPERRIEAAAPAPYPLAGDIAVDGVWLSDLQHQVGELEQAYDFASGELTSRFVFEARDRRVTCTVLTFASREDPTLVCQELDPVGRRRLRPAGAGRRGGVGGAGTGAAVPARHAGRGPGPLRRRPAVGISRGVGAGGLAYVTEMAGGESAEAEALRPALDASGLISTYAFRARAETDLPPAPGHQPRAQRPAQSSGRAGRSHGRQGAA
jgi:hypothetical protein